MTKAIEWYPEESGAMQPTSRPNKKGEVVFCCFCQAGIFVTTFGYGQDKVELSIKKSVWKCSGCKQTLNKHQLILDLIRWRVFNGHSKNYIGHINPYKEKISKTLKRKPSIIKEAEGFLKTESRLYKSIKTKSLKKKAKKKNKKGLKK